MVGIFIGDETRGFVVPDFDEYVESPFSFADRNGLLFVGNFRHPPNTEAVEWLLGDVVPRLDPTLLAAHPIRIVGNEPPESIVTAGQAIQGVEVVGWVPSLVPYLQRARVSVAPLRHGAGTKGKVIQALAAGTPVVTTSVGLEGLALKHGREVLLADDPSDFAQAITRLVSDEKLWSRLAKSGRSVMTETHSREYARQQLRMALESTLARKVKRWAGGEADRELKERLLKPRYRDLVRRIRELAERSIPADAKVAVVSRGDDELLHLGAAEAEHFPADETGAWLGWYPADGAQAADFLDRAVERRVDYFLVPDTASWWLEKYPELAQRLSAEWHEVIRDEGTCVVFSRSSANGGTNGKQGP